MKLSDAQQAFRSAMAKGWSAKIHQLGNNQELQEFEEPKK